jgi:hypothetical protein
MEETEVRVFRVETRASTYHVAMGVLGGRPVAVLHGHSKGAVVREADGAPLIGDASLFDAAPAEWLDKPLRIGAVVTSPVASVAHECDPETTRDVTAFFTCGGSVDAPGERWSCVPPAAARPSPSSAVQRIVQHAEVAAWCLRRLDESTDGVVAVLADPEARARLHDALDGCSALLKKLAQKVP